MRLFRILLAVTFASQLVGQDPTIRTTVPLVVLPTSVMDRHGHPIHGLTPDDFVLLDNTTTKPVHLDEIGSGLPPVALVVLIQTSDVSLPALGKIRKVGAMISQSVAGEKGEVAVVTFSDQIEVVQDFTRDANAIANAFTDLQAADNMGGRMIDAVDLSLKMLASRQSPSRSNILILGESKDRGSRTKLEEMKEKLKRNGVTVYALTYSAYLTAFTVKPEEYEPSGGGLLTGFSELARLGKQSTTAALTGLTGGVAASFETKAKLEKELLQLASDIHNQYLLSFVPDQAQTPSFHQLSLRIKEHPDAVIRTRPGYWAGF